MTAQNVVSLDPARSLRLPPHNHDAERALLGAIMANNRIYDSVCEIVAADQFADTNHARIFEAIGKLVERGRTANAITLKNYFEQHDSLKDVGGTPYLAALQGFVVTPAAAMQHAEIVRDCWQRRELAQAAERVIESCHNPAPDGGVADTVEQLDVEIDRLFDGPQALTLATAGAAMESANRRADEAARAGSRVEISIGMPGLDDVLGGLSRGSLYVIGARPSMGKSALAFWLAHGSRARCHIVSLEMTAEQIGRRWIAGLSGVPLPALKTGRMAQADWTAVAAAQAESRELPITICDTQGLTVAMIRAQCRRLRRRGGLDVLFVDHLGLVRVPKDEARHGPTWAIEQTSRAFKELAKELQVAVVLLCQLNRGVEGRDDKRPTLADLRQSGAIEQDADAVMMLFREEYYVARRQPGPTADAADVADWEAEMRTTKGVAEVHVLKQRDGPTGVVKLRFDAQTARFYDAEQLRLEGGT